MAAVEHPFAYLKKRADVLACCGDPKNLFVRTLPDGRSQLAVCKECGRRHRKMYAEAGSLIGRGMGALLSKGEKKLILPGDPAFGE